MSPPFLRRPFGRLLILCASSEAGKVSMGGAMHDRLSLQSINIKEEDFSVMTD